MKKVPVKKNLSDQDMLVGYVEEKTFETDVLIEETPVKKIKPAPKNTTQDSKTAFFSKELQEDVSKALLELKVKLYKEGIVDYDLKVSQKEHQVIITAIKPNQKEK